MSSHADRQRLYKRRQRQGEAVLLLDVHYYDLVEALLTSGRLTEEEALDRRQVARAAGDVLADWIARWKG
jgi:hypothetical protein